MRPSPSSRPNSPFRILRRDPVAWVCAIILAAIILAAIATPWIAPHHPYRVETYDLTAETEPEEFSFDDLDDLDFGDDDMDTASDGLALDLELPPAWLPDGKPTHALGTDSYGHDLLSAILYGLRVSLLVGLGAVVIQTLLGTFIGLVAGYFGGRLDRWLMRLADIQLSLSTLMIAIIAMAVVRASFGEDAYHRWALWILILVIGIAEWPAYARTVRASVLAERHKEYVQAAVALGRRHAAILLRHILPNVSSAILVIATIQVANAIIAESALSFLGLGMPVDQPSLGRLVDESRSTLLAGKWWLTAFPGLAIIVPIFCINLLGDRLRDALDPTARS